MVPSFGLQLFLFLLSATLSLAINDWTQYVEPRIGSGGAGYGVGSINPGPQVPFGAIRLGPDTDTYGFYLGFNHCGGYYFNDTHIRAFSHTHLVGAGVPDFGNIGATVARKVTDETIVNNNYRSRFSHESETVEPGFYGVTLEDAQTAVELTVTGTHSGIHRYTCKGGDEACYFLVDVCHTASENDRKACVNASVGVQPASDPSNPTIITGHVLNSGSLSGRSPIGGVNVYFVMQVEANITSGFKSTIWQDGKLDSSGALSAATTSGSMGAVLSAPSSNQPTQFLVRVGISFISVEMAILNLMNQQVQPGSALTLPSPVPAAQAIPLMLRAHAANDFISFDDARAVLKAEWNQWLNRVQVSNGDSNAANLGRQRRLVSAGPADMVKMYSAVYRTFLAPTIYSESDAGASYLGFDGAVHSWRAKHAEGVFMSDMSIWDTHRSEAPWLAIVAPEISRSMANSLVAMAHEGGKLPRWPLANVYTECMEGSHAVAILTDIVLKHPTWLNNTEVYQVMKQALMTQDATKGYNQYGYVPTEDDKRAGSITLEYAFDDGSLANAAAALGYTADAHLFRNRSMRYQNIFEADKMLMCGRSTDGSFSCPEFPALPYPFNDDYVEGDAWQWQWFVPHDVRGLVKLYPSAEVYAERLEVFFQNSTDWIFGNLLPNPFYWAGNEPDLLAPWMFPFAGAKYATRTQYWTRYLVNHLYNTRADGIPGNDDYGTMSAWEIFAYLGFYPVTGTSEYVLGSPVFDAVSVFDGSNASVPVLKVESLLNNATNWRVLQASVNDKVVVGGLFEHKDCFSAGMCKLSALMGPGTE